MSWVQTILTKKHGNSKITKQPNKQITSELEPHANHFYKKKQCLNMKTAKQQNKHIASEFWLCANHFKFHFCPSGHCSGLIRENGLSNCILHDKQYTSYNNVDVAVDEEVDTEVAMW